MSRRKPAKGQAELLADITKLSQFPRRKQRQPGRFDGARNPREMRFLQTILHRHMTREEVDSVAGASNGPELINQLRERGLEIPCYRLGAFDRDGCWVWRGLYALTPRDRVQVARALAGKGGAAGNSAGTAAGEAAKGTGGRNG